MPTPNSFLTEVLNGVKTNLNSKRKDLEKRMRKASDKAKKSSLFNDLVVPAVESDKAEKVLTYLEDKFKGRSKGSSVVKIVRNLQKDIIDQKAVHVEKNMGKLKEEVGPTGDSKGKKKRKKKVKA